MFSFAGELSESDEDDLYSSGAAAVIQHNKWIVCDTEMFGSLTDSNADAVKEELTHSKSPSAKSRKSGKRWRIYVAEKNSKQKQKERSGLMFVQLSVMISL